MKKISVLFAALILLGTGCTQPPTPAPVPFEQTGTQDEHRTEAPSKPEGNEQTTTSSHTVFTFNADSSYQVDRQNNGEYIRVQNFISQDSPSSQYPKDAFFIEMRTMKDLMDTPEEELLQGWKSGYGSVTETELNGTRVLFGQKSEVMGDSWPHTGYFIPGHGIVTLYSTTGESTDPGQKLAEEVVQSLTWN